MVDHPGGGGGGPVVSIGCGLEEVGGYGWDRPERSGWRLQAVVDGLVALKGPGVVESGDVDLGPGEHGGESVAEFLQFLGAVCR